MMEHDEPAAAGVPRASVARGNPAGMSDGHGSSADGAPGPVQSSACGSPPGTLSTLRTLAGVTLLRLVRGKALWIGAAIAALPAIYGIAMKARRTGAPANDVMYFALLLLVLLPAMFVGASIGEEIEDRTSTYLWSRPIARWAVLAGKLCALTPIVIALVVTSWSVAIALASGHPPSLASCAALALGTTAASLVTAAIATLVPKHGMALTIGYMLVDSFLGALPFSLREISVTHQTLVLSGVERAAPTIATPLIALIVVAGLWSALALRRIRRLEV